MPRPRFPLMIFGAGFGTRMGSLTRDCPKPLIPVAGQSLLDHALDLADDAGAQPVVVNTHYLHDRMAAHLSGRDVTLSHESPDILDTGGGLRHALPHLGPGPVLTLNPDCIWTGPNPLTALMQGWTGGEMRALMMLVPVTRAHAHHGTGDFDIAEDGRLVRGGSFVFGGAQIVDPSGLDRIPDRAFSLNRYWDLLAQRGGLFGLVHAGDWCDVGHPKGLEAAERLLSGQASDV